MTDTIRRRISTAAGLLKQQWEKGVRAASIGQATTKMQLALDELEVGCDPTEHLQYAIKKLGRIKAVQGAKTLLKEAVDAARREAWDGYKDLGRTTWDEMTAKAEGLKDAERLVEAMDDALNNGISDMAEGISSCVTYLGSSLGGMRPLAIRAATQAESRRHGATHVLLVKADIEEVF